MKKYFNISLIITIISFLLSGCNNKLNIKKNNDPPKNLIYYTIGSPDKDLKIVNQELNNLLVDKINVTVEYNKILWADYGERLATMINSGTNFDIAFAASVSQGDFIGNAQKGAWLNLNPYLDTIGKEMHQSINPLLWEGIKIDNKIYGVPTNKEIAVPIMFMYPQSIVQKYNIDIKKYNSIESLEPLLRFIDKTEPEYLGLELDSSSINLFAIDGYEYILTENIPLMVKSSDKDLEIINIFETDYCYNLLSNIRKYYKQGYINQDAAIKESGSLSPNEKVFLKISEGGPYSDIIWSNDRKYKVVSHTVSNLVVTSASTQGSVMVANAKTKHPQECVKFLNCINTDKQVRNMLNFGIKDKHYTLTDNNQVNKISNNYSGVQYTQGNWFILNTVVGEPLDKWSQFTIFNNSAYKSEILGFNPNTHTYKNEIIAIQNVWKKYYPFLMTGSVDIDYFLPKFNEELKLAGIDNVKKILQLQLDNWKKY